MSSPPPTARGTSHWFDETRALTLSLVSHASVTHTLGEVTFAALLRDILAKQPYFTSHPEHLRVETIRDDPLGRANVYALVRGSGTRTVVLAGHYDVVSTANYGALEPWACEPELLLSRLIDDLRAHGRSDADRRALRDLESGDFLPGRGSLDMKSGLAAAVAVLGRFGDDPGSVGNLLFVATPDEEDRSTGMRAATPRLAALASMWGLTLESAINLDATGDPTDGREGQVVYLGSVGKLLVSLYVVGCDTHAGYPFDGINANYLAAQVTSAVECNPELADASDGEAAPPPTTLKQIDCKVGHDVTTPVAAWVCYNVLTHRSSSADVMARMRAAVTRALSNGLVQLADRAKQHAALQGKEPTFTGGEPLVLSFAELRARVVASGGEELERQLAILVRRLASDDTLDLASFSRIVTDWLWRRSGLTGPAAVLGFASLPYPAVHLDLDEPRESAVRALVLDEVASSAEALGVTLGIRGFFQGISDMSFLGRVRPEELAYIAAETPPWGSVIRWDLTRNVTAGIPTINAGPWGRDYHQRLERVYAPYSFGVLPELIARIARRLLRGNGQGKGGAFGRAGSEGDG